jgi:hypothetical protein
MAFRGSARAARDPSIDPSWERLFSAIGNSRPYRPDPHNSRRARYACTRRPSTRPTGWSVGIRTPRYRRGTSC